MRLNRLHRAGLLSGLLIMLFVCGCIPIEDINGPGRLPGSGNSGNQPCPPETTWNFVSTLGVQVDADHPTQVLAPSVNLPDPPNVFIYPAHITNSDAGDAGMQFYLEGLNNDEGKIYLYNAADGQTISRPPAGFIGTRDVILMYIDVPPGSYQLMVETLEHRLVTTPIENSASSPPRKQPTWHSNIAPSDARTGKFCRQP